MSSILDNLIFLNLLLITITNWAGLIYSRLKFLINFSLSGTILANSLLFILLGSRWITSGYFPLSNLYESLLFLAWCITLLVVFYKKLQNLILLDQLVAQFHFL